MKIEIDENKIIIKAINNGTIFFKEPYIKYVNQFSTLDNEKFFTLIDGNLDIYLLAYSIEDLAKQLEEEFNMLYQEYVLEKDSNLTQDAIELKYKLIDMLIYDHQNYNYAEKYIKKPVVVEAFHYRKNYTDWEDLKKFCPYIVGVDKQNNPIIKTLEGEVSLYDDCYVIKGIKGECYPCQKEIFEMTYERVTNNEI